MSELRSVLDQLGSIDPEEISAEELAAEIAEAIYGQQVIESWSPGGSSRCPIVAATPRWVIRTRRRVWTTAQRRAIIARDRHCQADGCDRDYRYCDIHHIEHWADGGGTTVDNGVLLCRFHHTTEHLDQARHRRRSRT